MSKKLYLECYSGISGDMMVGALLDLGADQEVLQQALDSLSIEGFHTHISRVSKAGLDTCDFNVILDAAHDNHDHDMEYLHGEGHHHEHDTEHGHHHESDHHHHHDHDTAHHHHHDHNHDTEQHHDHTHAHPHEHRGLADILAIIEQADMTVHAKEIAIRIFKILARAEAQAHGVDLEQVHFHEVGAVDSIVDIVAVAVCLDHLGIQEVIVPVLYEGSGFVRCQHGMIPIPVPAVSHIVANHGLSLHLTRSEGEFVTPTGAAIVAAIRTSDALPEQFTIQDIGIGAGKRNYETPSIIRAMLIREDVRENGNLYKLESNIDDCSGEALGYVMEQLLEAGAHDVHYLPVFMKKNRPAYQLNVICQQDDMAKLEQIIFEETTTVGIRRLPVECIGLERELYIVETSLGSVQVKVCHLPSGTRLYPEYNSVIEQCKKHHLSYQHVYQLIQKECAEQQI